MVTSATVVSATKANTVKLTLISALSLACVSTLFPVQTKVVELSVCAIQATQGQTVQSTLTSVHPSHARTMELVTTRSMALNVNALQASLGRLAKVCF